MVIDHAWDLGDPVRQALIPPLQDRSRAGPVGDPPRPELGGAGYGQVKLALLNEILGPLAQRADRVRVSGAGLRQRRDPRPLRHRRAEARYLEPLLARRDLSCLLDDRAAGRIRPTGVRDRGRRDGDEWVINGEKWFSSNAHFASFFIVDGGDRSRGGTYRRHVDVHRARPRRRASRSSATSACRPPEATGTHGYVRYTDVRVPADHMLGRRAARRSRSPRLASAVAASTTPCAPSDWRQRRST